MLAAGPFHLTAAGAAKLRLIDDARARDALALAEILPPIARPELAALGVVVKVRDDLEKEHAYHLVSATERALLGEGCSVEGPIGRALLGSRVGDVCEVVLPRGSAELEVIALESADP